MTKPKPEAEPKARMGRPPVADEARRDNLIRVLVTSSEQDELRRAADAAGMSASTWMRAVALEKARRGT